MKRNLDPRWSLFPDAATVKASVDLVDYASCLTRLRRCGRQWVGLCPLHRERRPSFFVHPLRQVFFCHGCHRGGDIFSLVMYHNACGFAEAVRAVARFGKAEGPPPKAKPKVGFATPKASRPHSWEPELSASTEAQPVCLDISPRDIPPCFFAEIATLEDVEAYRGGACFSFASTTTNNC